jgi:hypothetical protein
LYLAAFFRNVGASPGGSADNICLENDSLCITCPTFDFNDSTLALLKRPPKFIPTPKSCCHVNILRGVRDFLRRYRWRVFFSGKTSSAPRFFVSSGTDVSSTGVPAQVWRKCALVMSAVRSLLSQCSTCYPKDNLSESERLELDRLCSDPSIVVSPADKGGKWVIVPRAEYESEALRQLSEANFYRPLDAPLTDLVATRLSNFLNFLQRKHFLTRREVRALQPPDAPVDRRFYLIPKLHKPTWPTAHMPPGRPIVSDTASVSRGCASLIEHFLTPIARKTPSFVRDSLHVVSLLKDVILTKPVILFTMDITSLYTNIPTNEGIAAVGRAFLKHTDAKRPDLTILSLLRLLLTTNDFMFGDHRFLQTHGTAMGCAFGGAFANIFLSEWEEKILNHPKPPCLWLRYIDDVFGVWPHDDMTLSSFCSFVNSIHGNIQVTLTSSPTKVKFLDLEIYLSEGRLLHNVGFKPTDSFTILPPSSFHPQHVFTSIMFSQVYRWCTRSSSYHDFKRTKNLVQKHWMRQGYTRSQIRDVVKKVLSFTGQTPSAWQPGFFPCSVASCVCIYSFYAHSVYGNDSSFPIVHRLSCESSKVVYLISCLKCDMKYVGETSRSLRERISEHLRSISRCLPTPVAQHFTTRCQLDDFSFTAIEHQANDRKRRKKESAWIGRLRTAVPAGLNTVTNRHEALPLVLPYSRCSERVVRLCQSMVDVTTVGAFRCNKNLARLVTANR